MKNTIKIISLHLLIALSFTNIGGIHAQGLYVEPCPSWQYLQPVPVGKEDILNYQIFMSRNGIMVLKGNYNGLISKDTGKTWQYFPMVDTMNNPIPASEINDLLIKNTDFQVINDSVAFYVNDSDLIRETTDGGLHWFLNGGTFYNFYGSLHMITETLGWGLNYNNSDKIVITNNAGKTWNILYSDTNVNYDIVYFLNSQYIWIVSQKYDSNTYIYTHYLHKTTNGGISWENSLSWENTNTTIIGKQIPTDWHFIDSLHGVGSNFPYEIIINGYNEYYSDTISFSYTSDGGNTWLPFANPFITSPDSEKEVVWAVDSLGNVSVIVYPGSGDQYPYYGDSTPAIQFIFGYTSDNGATWERDSSYPQDASTAGSDPNGVFFLGGNLIGLAGAPPDLLRISTDGGKTWTRENNPFGDYSLYKFFFTDRNNGFGLTTALGSPEMNTSTPLRGAGLYRTYDAGRNWKLILTNGVYGFDWYDYQMPNVLWVGAGYGNPIAYRSFDGGNSFQLVTTMPTNNSGIVSVDFIDSLQGWAFSLRDGIWKTTDGGATWEQQQTETPSSSQNPYDWFVGECMIDSEYGWMGQNNFVFLHTTNGGASWDTANVPSILDYFYGVKFLNRNHGYIFGIGGVADSNETDETFDGGKTWDTLPIGGSDLHFRDSLFGWVQGHITSDGGKTWYAEPFSDYYNTVILGWGRSWWADTSEGWTGDDYGTLYHYGSFDSVTDDVNESSGISASMNKMLSNYPNPFSSSTTVSYTLPAAGNVSLNVYNALGEQVATLANGVQSVGIQTATFLGAGLPAGVYFYRLVAEKEMKCGMMVLMH